MKLNEFSLPSNGIMGSPTTVDLDVAARLGPAVSQHISSLEALCRLTPNCAELQEKLNELKALFSACVPMQANVLEAPKEVDIVGVLEMFESLEPALGSRAWLHITKKLRDDGYHPRMVSEAVDAAISLKG